MRTRALLVVLTVSCATRLAAAQSHAYVPQIDKFTVAHGELAISSYGLALVDVGSEPVLALHVRANVTNSQAQPWSLDAASAIVAVPSSDENLHPLAINSDPATLPIIVAGPNEHRTVDFFFPAPQHVYDDVDVAGFSFAWLGASATFARQQLANDQDIDFAAGRHHHWWFDPTFPWPFFNHVDGVVTRKSPTVATVAWLHGDQEDSDDDLE